MDDDALIFEVASATRAHSNAPAEEIGTDTGVGTRGDVAEQVSQVTVTVV